MKPATPVTDAYVRATEVGTPRAGLWDACRRVLLTPVGKRLPVGRRLANGERAGAPHGIALFTVLIGLALMSAVVTDFGYNELLRYKLAAHERDAMKAQALNESALNFSRLLLSVQAAIQPMVTQLASAGIPLPAQTVWELLPLDCELLKSLASGELHSAFGLDVSTALAKRTEEAAKKQEARLEDWDAEAEGAGGGPFEPPEAGFGAFQGTCAVQIQDEERKPVSLRGWASTMSSQVRFSYAERLMKVFAPERYDFLFEERDAYGAVVDRQELIANLYDWIDSNEDATDPRSDGVNWGRQSGGVEESLYSSYRNLEPKNAYYDSPGELRLVHGYSDAHEKAFGELISIYAENKINLLSAPPHSVEALVRICAQNPTDFLLYNREWMAETLQLWGECKQLGMLAGCQISPEGFMTFLEGRGLLLDRQMCSDNIGMESKNFTVRATSTVGDATRTTTLVLRVHGATEEVYFYSVR